MKLSFSKNKFFFYIALTLAITDAFILFNTSSNILSIVIFIFLLLIPGLLTLILIGTRKISFYTNFILAIGLGLTFLLLTGIVTNFFWPILFKMLPLTKFPLFYTYNFLSLILLFAAYIKAKTFSFKISKKSFSYINFFLFAVPPCITLMIILGTFNLNNNGSNILTMISLGGIALYMIYLLIKHKDINENIFPYAIFFFGLSLLFMLSLRSWYITGWDIQDEYKVFQLTKHLGYWSPLSIKDDYNSCLSITILPTLFSYLTSLADQYVFKIIYQILFATVPVTIYLIARKYSSSIISFFVAVYFFSEPFYIQPMTALMRQEIAFIFFVFMMLILFQDKIKRYTRELLFIVFGLSMVISHYSMTYISLIILISTYLLITLYRQTEHLPKISKLYSLLQLRKSRTKIMHKYFIYPEAIIIIFVFAFIWYSQVNKNATHAIQVSQSFVKNINNIFSSDQKNQESQKAIALVKTNTNSLEVINSYIFNKVYEFKTDKNTKYTLTASNSASLYPVLPKDTQSYVNTFLYKSLSFLLQIIKQISKVFVIIGLLFLLFRKFRTKDFDREFIILGVISEVFIAIMIADPALAAEYNLSRLYLQLLTVLALPAILGGIYLLSVLKKHSLYVVGGITILLFLYLTGFINQIIGGEAFMHLNNFGSDYDKFYVHKQEVAAIQWLSSNRNKKLVIFADRTAQLRMTFVPYMYVDNTVLPQIIFKDGYVYADYANIHDNLTDGYLNGSDITYSFPSQFLNQNKNLIYNNGGSEIWK